jgi:CheY-like chemotaxis protein
VTEASSESNVAILLVDDEDANLLALEAVLGELGHRLVKARSGEAALLELLHTDFAVVLLDVRMQQLSGFEVGGSSVTENGPDIHPLSSSPHTTEIPSSPCPTRIGSVPSII